jgi:hypothetical protein
MKISLMWQKFQHECIFSTNILPAYSPGDGALSFSGLYITTNFVKLLNFQVFCDSVVK